MVHPRRLILIGYWAGPDTDQSWPRPEAFVDPDWDPDVRDLVVAYLSRGFIVRSYMGYSTCRMCGEQNGDLELSDGTYVWPEGLVHNLRKHDVRLPELLVAHAVAAVESMERADRDEDWWRSLS